MQFCFGKNLKSSQYCIISIRILETLLFDPCDKNTKVYEICCISYFGTRFSWRRGSCFLYLGNNSIMKCWWGSCIDNEMRRQKNIESLNYNLKFVILTVLVQQRSAKRIIYIVRRNLLAFLPEKSSSNLKYLISHTERITLNVVDIASVEKRWICEKGPPYHVICIFNIQVLMSLMP